MNIHAIGGYNEVGKNMTALELEDDAVIFDAGIFLPAIVGVQEREKIPTEKGMRALGALPDDHFLDTLNLRHKVRAIACSHAHLDHIAAVPYIASKYKSVILGTPFTMEVLKSTMKDASQTVPNPIRSVNPNAQYTLKTKKPLKVEFINITHSTIQSAMIAVHTPEGIVLYANDYKLDNSPIFGDRPNYHRLKELAKIGIKAFVVDCLYAPDDRKTPSEKIAKGLLEDVFHSTDNRSGLIVTTFSSHIARLKTITELGRKLGRKVVFLGRSLSRYVSAADKVGKAPFMNSINLVTYRRHLESTLKKINSHKKEYLVVCTGHQGEPGSILERLSKGKLPLRVSENDRVIFSSKTIPTPINEESKAKLVNSLKHSRARIFDNIHVSGHGGREDLRELVKILNPEHIIPSHGDLLKRTAGANLAEEMGYKIGKTVHLLDNRGSVKI